MVKKAGRFGVRTGNTLRRYKSNADISKDHISRLVNT